MKRNNSLNLLNLSRAKKPTPARTRKSPFSRRSSSSTAHTATPGSIASSAPPRDAYPPSISLSPDPFLHPRSVLRNPPRKMFLLA